MNSILEAREQRELLIDSLQSEYPTNVIVSIHANIPGDNKNINEAFVLVNLFYSKLNKQFHVIHEFHHESQDGPFILLVCTGNELEMKHKTIHIEDHYPLGRFIDLDIYKNHKSIKRSSLSQNRRLCYLCDKEATICRREGNHHQDDLIQTIKKRTFLFIKDTLLQFAKEALIDEVELHPKFGLVTKHSKGCHKDMDYDLFLDSINALQPFFAKYIDTYIEPRLLRIIGIQAERSMLKATNGINTHKGANFLFGFVLPSIVKAILNRWDREALQNDLVEVSTKLLQKDFLNLEQKRNKTYGERIYLNTTLKGVKGEVLDGLNHVFYEGLQTLRKYQSSSKKVKYTNTLITLMSVVDDTTLLHHHPFSILSKVKNDMKDLIALDGLKSEEGYQLFLKLSSYYKAICVSPGGSADLLGITIFIDNVTQLFNLDI